MRPSTLLSIVGVALLCWTASAQAGDNWIEIEADGSFDDNGVIRTPSCSGGPELVDTPFGPLPVAADTQYSFFVRHGDPRKLAILFDGGGTCFDANTCVGTALAGGPIYSQKVDETVESLAFIGGVGDNNNPDNPIADYTQVFIPYCTGDLHTGANDKTYLLPFDGSVIPWEIHHRGADNVAFVLRWLDEYYGDLGVVPRKVFLTGLSAGGYGVVYHTPAIADRLPWRTRLRVLADAASGVITENFYSLALSENGAWSALDNLHPVLAGAFSAGPDQIIIEIYKALGSTYPRARFGQYTTALDTTQIAFFNIDKNINDPSKWADPAELALAGFEWSLRARTYQILTALQVWNYRFYLGAGADHTVLASDKFFTEDSARRSLVDWLDDMINRRWSFGGDWRNSTCAPNCVE